MVMELGTIETRSDVVTVAVASTPAESRTVTVALPVVDGAV
jgi:hypothetical protein